MNKNYKIILLTCFVCGFRINSKAQQNTVSSGGEATGSGGTVSYSTGQTDYITVTGSGGTASQGVQQPFEIFVATGVEETSINLTAAIFPNPVENSLTLTVETISSNMSFSIYDSGGKLIRQENLISAQTIISLSEISNGIYFLKIKNNEKELKSFKVIKNK